MFEILLFPWGGMTIAAGLAGCNYVHYVCTSYRCNISMVLPNDIERLTSVDHSTPHYLVACNETESGTPTAELDSSLGLEPKPVTKKSGGRS